MLVLFLDFNGVLHRELFHASRHFECVAAFNSAIFGLEVEIVVSSTWRRNLILEEIKALLPEFVASQIFGITPKYSCLVDVPKKCIV